MSVSGLSGMDIAPSLPAKTPVKLTTSNEGLAGLYGLLKQARDQNSITRFQKIMAEAHHSDLASLWPQLIKLTVYSLPVDTQYPGTNNKFSLALQDYCEEHESTCTKQRATEHLPL